MSRVARALAADPLVDDESGASAPSHDVVQLFARLGDRVTPGSAGAPSEGDWTASIDLVRRVAERVRSVHQKAQIIALEAQQIVRSATASAQAAQESASEAEARAQAALAQADQATNQVRLLGAKLAAAEKRAVQAEARADEAHVWLQRMHDCMASEFATLTVDPL